MASNQNGTASATATRPTPQGAACARDGCGCKNRHHYKYVEGQVVMACAHCPCPGFLREPPPQERAAQLAKFLMPLAPSTHQELQALNTMLEHRLGRFVGLCALIRALIAQRLASWAGSLSMADVEFLRGPIRLPGEPPIWQGIILLEQQAVELAALANRTAMPGARPRGLPAITTAVTLAQLGKPRDLAELEQLILGDTVKPGRPATGRQLRSPAPEPNTTAGAA